MPYSSLRALICVHDFISTVGTLDTLPIFVGIFREGGGHALSMCQDVIVAKLMLRYSFACKDTFAVNTF